MGVTIRVLSGWFLNAARRTSGFISPSQTFFPEQDTGVLMGGIQADRHLFRGHARQTAGFYENYSRRSAVNNVTGFTGGSRVNSGMMFITR